MRDAVQEAPAPQSPSKAVQQLRKSLERPADRPRPRAPPPPTTARDAATALHARGARQPDATTDQCRRHARGRGARRPGAPRSGGARGPAAIGGRAGGAAPDGKASTCGSSGSRRRLPMDPFAGNAETFVRAAHAFAGDGDQELTIERDQALLVRTAHLADASGWVFAVAVDDGEGEPRCGYVPISHLGGAVSPRFFQDGASQRAKRLAPVLAAAYLERAARAAATAARPTTRPAVKAQSASAPSAQRPQTAVARAGSLRTARTDSARTDTPGTPERKSDCAPHRLRRIKYRSTQTRLSTRGAICHCAQYTHDRAH